jgi:hypothetical protein
VIIVQDVGKKLGQAALDHRDRNFDCAVTALYRQKMPLPRGFVPEDIRRDGRPTVGSDEVLVRLVREHGPEDRVDIAPEIEAARKIAARRRSCAV